MPKKKETLPFNDVRYSTKEALQMLGIVRDTLYSYIKSVIIPDRRNPKNGYRVFLQEDLDKVRECLNGIVK